MLPFVGPSYNLAIRKASASRTVNMVLVGMETPSKAPFILQSIPGLNVFAALGAAIRGGIEADGRAFAVAGSNLYEFYADGTSESRGALATSTGAVDFAYGLTQLVMVDGDNGYVLTLSTDAFTTITDTDFVGSNRVWFIDNYFMFAGPGTQQYQISAINDATLIDGLDFASAESHPDDIVAHLVLQDDVVLMGELKTEFAFNDPSAADFPFRRSRGLGFSVGLAAAHSAQTVDNGAYWIGKDENGTGIVYQMVGRQHKRISTQPVEQALQASTDISNARAFCYQKNGLTYYCVNAPGVTTTWCYEVSTGTWHERADLDVNGQFEQHRGTCHIQAFGKHLLGADDGTLYELDDETYTNAGDALVRERISPHTSAPGRVYLFFKSFVLDCLTGEAPQGVEPEVELSWSKDSGATWGNPALKSIGAIGERIARVFWPRLGIRSRDICWKVRFSGNAPFAIVDAGADADKGTS